MRSSTALSKEDLRRAESRREQTDVARRVGGEEGIRIMLSDPWRDINVGPLLILSSRLNSVVRPHATTSSDASRPKTRYRLSLIFADIRIHLHRAQRCLPHSLTLESYLFFHVLSLLPSTRFSCRKSFNQ